VEELFSEDLQEKLLQGVVLGELPSLVTLKMHILTYRGLGAVRLTEMQHTCEHITCLADHRYS